jgi:hypothetical protein
MNEWTTLGSDCVYLIAAGLLLPMHRSTGIARRSPRRAQPAVELSDAIAEGGVQIPSPNPRWTQASGTGFDPEGAARRPLQ